jgi:hypothetical protein
VPEDDRPRSLDDKSRPVFAARGPAADGPILGVVPADYTTRFLKDWISALVQVMQENAGDVRAEGFDIEANDRLGTILQGLGTVPA